MTAQELKDLIAKKEKQISLPSLPDSAKGAIKKQVEALKAQLDDLEKAEKKVESAEKKVEQAEKKDDEKKVEQAEKKADEAKQELDKEEKKAESKAKKAKKEMSEAQKKAQQKYQAKKKAEKEAAAKKKQEEEEAKKKKEAAAKKKSAAKKRAKKATKVEAKAKKKAKPKAEKKERRKKKATKQETISSFLAKNKKAKQKYKGVSMASKKRDAGIPAKPFGYRLAGTNRRPTKDEIKSGKAYWEGRPTKADVRRTGYPKLETGGMLDETIIGNPNNPEWLAGGSYFAKGGGIFNIGGGKGNRTHHNRGAAWTLDHYQQNKREDYEVPLKNRVNKRKRK